MMPASTAPLHAAYRLQDDAADCGFDWPTIDGVRAKLHEELAEFAEAAAAGDKAAIEHELGDVLFTVVNLARWHKVQPDMALRQANARFRARFELIEAEFRTAQRRLQDATIDELEASWQRAKSRLSD